MLLQRSEAEESLPNFICTMSGVTGKTETIEQHTQIKCFSYYKKQLKSTTEGVILPTTHRTEKTNPSPNLYDLPNRNPNPGIKKNQSTIITTLLSGKTIQPPKIQTLKPNKKA